MSVNLNPGVPGNSTFTGATNKTAPTHQAYVVDTTVYSAKIGNLETDTLVVDGYEQAWGLKTSSVTGYTSIQFNTTSPDPAGKNFRLYSEPGIDHLNENFLTLPAGGVVVSATLVGGAPYDATAILSLGTGSSSIDSVEIINDALPGNVSQGIAVITPTQAGAVGKAGVTAGSNPESFWVELKQNIGTTPPGSELKATITYVTVPNSFPPVGGELPTVLRLSTPEGFDNPNGYDIEGTYRLMDGQVDGKAYWERSDGQMVIHWAEHWKHWIVDSDTTLFMESVAWYPDPGLVYYNSVMPPLGTFELQWNFGTEAGNNGVHIPKLVLEEVDFQSGSGASDRFKISTMSSNIPQLYTGDAYIHTAKTELFDTNTLSVGGYPLSPNMKTGTVSGYTPTEFVTSAPVAPGVDFHLYSVQGKANTDTDFITLPANSIVTSASLVGGDPASGSKYTFGAGTTSTADAPMIVDALPGNVQQGVAVVVPNSTSSADIGDGGEGGTTQEHPIWINNNGQAGGGIPPGLPMFATVTYVIVP